MAMVTSFSRPLTLSALWRLQACRPFNGRRTVSSGSVQGVRLILRDHGPAAEVMRKETFEPDLLPNGNGVTVKMLMAPINPADINVIQVKARIAERLENFSYRSRAHTRSFLPCRRWAEGRAWAPLWPPGRTSLTCLWATGCCPRGTCRAETCRRTVMGLGKASVMVSGKDSASY